MMYLWQSAIIANNYRVAQKTSDYVRVNNCPCDQYFCIKISEQITIT